jgi:hypothetical protein
MSFPVLVCLVLACARAAITLPNGTLDVSLDTTTKLIKFTVHVKDNSYIAFGWGSTMTNTDMVFWSASGGASTQKDLYSTGHSNPSVDAANAYTTTFTQSGGFVDFVSTRKLEGNGGVNDFVASLDTNIACCYAYHSSNANLVQHQGRGQLTVKLSTATTTGTTGQSGTTNTNGTS